MLDRQNHSITNRALEAATDPLYFNLCGFEGSASSVASYYDFLVRLWQSSQKLHLDKKIKLRSFSSKPKKKLNKNEKLPSRKPGSVNRLVTKVLNGKLRNFCPEHILQKLLKHCVVDQSAKMVFLEMLMISLLQEMVHHIIQEPVIMVPKPATVVPEVSSTALVPKILRS